jgi:hypothetical protein
MAAWWVASTPPCLSLSTPDQPEGGRLRLNLTEADYCFLLDPWWNPAAETQAIDRAHRIGQTRPVIANRMIARETIEELLDRTEDLPVSPSDRKHIRKMLDGISSREN